MADISANQSSTPPTPAGGPPLRWYHTIELPGGAVTPGEYDTRRALRKIPFPQSLAGLRCLDVGTHDGFWAFEMERRAAAEVVAIDLDDPARVDISEPVPERLPDAALADRRGRPAAFAYAHRALNSNVIRRDLSVYDLERDEIGEFDFAFVGTLLLHLSEPVRALTAVRKVLRPGRSGARERRRLIVAVAAPSEAARPPFDAAPRTALLVGAERSRAASIPREGRIRLGALRRPVRAAARSRLRARPASP